MIQLQTLVSGVGKTNFTLDISPSVASEEVASRSCWRCWPARFPPYLLLLFLVHVFVSVHGVRRPYTGWYVYRVSSRHLVCASVVSATSMVCLRTHNADVLVYNISLNTSCGNFRVSMGLSRWVLCGSSLLDWNDTEYLDTGGRVIFAGVRSCDAAVLWFTLLYTV